MLKKSNDQSRMHFSVFCVICILPCINSVGVHGVEISLVEIYEEHNIVPEAGDPVGSGHRDDEGKEII